MPMIEWKKVNFSEESGEFERVAKYFSEGPKGYKQNLSSIKEMYSKSSLENLTNSIWRNMENTDSFETDTIEKIQKAIGENTAGSGRRNIENVIKEFFSGKVRAPVVLQYDGGKLNTLIAGNTRLMVARMLDVPVKVALIKSDW